MTFAGKTDFVRANIVGGIRVHAGSLLDLFQFVPFKFLAGLTREAKKHLVCEARVKLPGSEQ